MKVGARTTSFYAMLLAGLLAGAACTGSPPRQAQTVPDTPIPSTGTSTLTPTPSSPPPISEARLRASALTIRDMPPGFHIYNTLAPDSGGTNYLCNKPGRTTPTHRLFEFFAKTNYGPFFGETLSSFPTSSKAKLAYQQLVAAGDSCSKFTSGGSTSTVSAMSFPTLGQRTFAVHLSDRGADAVESDHVYILQGRVLLHIAVGGTVSDPDLLNTLSRKAVARLKTEVPR